MGVLRSKVGWSLVVIYVVAFITVYSRVKPHYGTFVYDLGLDALAIPYILIVDGCSCSNPRSRSMPMSRGGWCRQSSSAAGCSYS
jgi:hypothetical protein